MAVVVYFGILAVFTVIAIGSYKAFRGIGLI
ncbi:cytochrome b6-f complex subunit PetL [Spirulina sp.]|jgi:hypothetical protein